MRLALAFLFTVIVLCIARGIQENIRAREEQR